MNRFTPVDPSALPDNVFDLIGRQWMLITAGDAGACNTMTASWGALGVLWNRPTAFIFVRPSRHTYGFVERCDTFSLCFFEESFRPALQLCGRVSGRDTDKIAAAGLTPRFDGPAPFFDQARLVLFCRKVYQTDLDPAAFFTPDIAANYPGGTDYHRMYAGQITDVWTR
ncbi:MAG: flavin reductase [Clostridia bacterium]|nr:flavin reductase [Clostridia bacterium]